MRVTFRFPWVLGLLCALMSLWARPTRAHPMGNFSINHYARFEARAGELALRYILDFAEIPTADQMTRLDRDGDGKVTDREKTTFLQTETPVFAQNLSLQLDGRRVPLRPKNAKLQLRPGAGGLETMHVTMEFAVPLTARAAHRVVYRDDNFPGRVGWMEILALAGTGRAIRESNAATGDRSRQLTVFPTDPDIVPPRQREAAFQVTTPGGATNSGATLTADSPAAPTSAEAAAPAANGQTPQNRFTQSIAERELTPGLVLAGIFVAFLFGGVHALSPGHGKTMVAAYLVGSRGTPRHAVLLGLVVTITHTFGVFALGLGLLFASRYILPERLFPALSAASGLIIFGVGLWLLMSRWQLLGIGHGHSHGPHTHSHDGHEHSHDHDGHDHDHEHHHDHDHEHAHAHGLVHSHGGRTHSHAVPEGPVTMRTLLALGISGGIVPCPEALVVLLAAVKLHRIGYGMVLIAAFSIGLAAALILIGLTVVAARQKLNRFQSFGEDGVLARYLPVGSAAVITIIGAALTLQAVGTP